MNPKCVVVACASFKGTLSSRSAGQAIARGLERAGIPSRVVALADGGEGLVEALVPQIPGAYFVETTVRGPLLDPVVARFGVAPPLDEATVIVEMAAGSGLSLVEESKRDPKRTTTLGVGDQVRAAVELPDLRVKRMLVGIGGSATNDGGAGMARALGARFLDKHGRELPLGGAALEQLAGVDVSGLDKRLDAVEWTVACDVTNPLCGPNGASFVYGPQKGATAEDVRLLDAALGHYADVLERDLHVHVHDVAGAGAAGGLGAGLLAFCKAKLVSGIDVVLDTLRFDDLLADAALVITGEGRIDGQTLQGKAPLGVARRAARENVPCVAIGGDVDDAAAEQLREHFQCLESLREFAGSIEYAKANAAAVLEELAYVRGREAAPAAQPGTWFAVPNSLSQSTRTPP